MSAPGLLGGSQMEGDAAPQVIGRGSGKLSVPRADAGRDLADQPLAENDWLASHEVCDWLLEITPFERCEWACRGFLALVEHLVHRADLTAQRGQLAVVAVDPRVERPARPGTRC